MKENNFRIWKEKLDWIAEREGMALLNVHPDYINVKNKRRTEEYPVNYYLDFLKYVRDTYQGKYWNALPIEVAQYFKSQTSNL